jgi:hypothetical protein
MCRFARQANLDAGEVKVYRNMVLLGALIGKPGSGAAYEVDCAPLSPVVRL